MVCLGLEPGAAEWKAQTNPLSFSMQDICYSFFVSSIFKFLMISWKFQTLQGTAPICPISKLSIGDNSHSS